MLDEPITLPPIGSGRFREADYWTPKNYDGGGGGTLTLREALENSRNLATVRLLVDRAADGSTEALRIGRVSTAQSARSRAVASQLMRRGVARCHEIGPDAPIVLDAQSYLVDWYARFGFAVSGEEYLEDGIPHRPMRREPSVEQVLR